MLLGGFRHLTGDEQEYSFSYTPTQEPIAHIIPESRQALEATGAAQREIETLASLVTGLPDTNAIYHGMRWTRVNQGHP